LGEDWTGVRFVGGNTFERLALFGRLTLFFTFMTVATAGFAVFVRGLEWLVEAQDFRSVFIPVTVFNGTLPPGFVFCTIVCFFEITDFVVFLFDPVFDIFVIFAMIVT